jgi:hypothetical protein
MYLQENIAESGSFKIMGKNVYFCKKPNFEIMCIATPFLR